uniref:cyclin-dependent kinase F-1 n=1 Tax=Erigeron canadensis TaxID=72917 RepID=UPI001CB9A77D|nr:cyclin-dependent kinase F-1 [Erigeron canadensis]
MEDGRRKGGKSWSIHTRQEIITKYKIEKHIGSGTYSDVYKAIRISDNTPVALKEVHDYQSAFREIEALQTLQHSPNVVVLHEYFWDEDDDEDAVLVLEYLPTDLSCVIRMFKKNGGLSVGEIKRWIVQILLAVDACHRSSIIHRDLKPANLLVSEDGVLKLADFGQARIRLAPGFVAVQDNPQSQSQESSLSQQQKPVPETEIISQENRSDLIEGPLGTIEEYEQLDHYKSKDPLDETDRETNFPDADTSCLATCTTSDVEEDFLKSNYSYETNDGGTEAGLLTSCVGTRWFRAPELLFGSTNYGAEIDLWSLGCIIAELFTLKPLFPGNSDIDQLSRIYTVLGNLNEEVWPGCTQLPDYQIISFSKVENPSGLASCLPNRSQDEISLVKKLICFDPTGRATAMELLHDKYLNEEPLPVPVSQLRVPSANQGADYGSSGSEEWGDHRDIDSDSDFDDFGGFEVTKRTGGDFSIQFS